MKVSRQRLSRTLPGGVLAGLMVLLLAGLSAGGAGTGPASAARSLTLTPTPDGQLVYLPLIMKDFPLVTAYGVEMASMTAAGGLDQVAGLQISWVRRNGVVWSQLQPTKGQPPDWGLLSALEQELIEARLSGLEVILVVRGTPSWARLPGYPDSQCGPIKPEEYASFASFLGQLVARYRDPPYAVRYWQIWNEPDAPVNSSSDPYGCWGDPTDAQFYGGDDYGQMLQAVSPAIKAADPAAQVLIGGLLMDCEPVSGCGPGSLPPESANFLRGILAIGAGSAFDGVAFHAYDHYLGAFGQYANGGWNSSWDEEGPALRAKAAFLRQVLASYGVTDKYLLNTETALICGAANDPPGQDPCLADPASDFEQTKANYVAQTYGAAAAEGLKANIWYSVLGWRNSGLLYGDLAPRPAYQAMTYARLALPNPIYLGPVADVGGAQALGYRFDQDGREVWVVWSTSMIEQLIALDESPTAVRDSQGNPDTDLDDGMLSPANTLYLIWE